MLPQHHLLQLVPNRVNATINRLQDAIWQDFRAVSVSATKSGPEQVPYADAIRQPLRPVSAGSVWGRLFDQRWCRIALPRTSGEVWLNWRDQGEATLYVDGKPYFGFDVGHHHCRLPRNTREVWIESHCMESGIWHPEATGIKTGSVFNGAFLCRRDDTAWGAYHDLKCLLDVALDMRSRENPGLPVTLNAAGRQPAADNHQPVYRQMLRMMDEAVDALELHGVDALRRRLAQAYAALRVDKTFMRCVITGHAHIDLVWLWPERMGEAKAVHTFSTMNRLMEEYPEFRFAYSQPASYEAVKRRSPRLYHEVMQRIRKGQWEATGALYVESDTLIACGEALARSFILGQEGFTKLSGKPSRLTWLPDVFGYSACLPQIMRQMGVDYFFTSKMTWNAVTRFPHSSFVWRGCDGSEVLAHVVQNVGYISEVKVNEVKVAMYGHQQADVHPEYLMPNGLGDGGGGPTSEMCERVRRLNSLPGMPEMKWDQPEAFFDRLAPLGGRLPVHQGECYLEYHRGTYTTHGNLKATFRGLERALHLAEAVSCATGKRWDLTHPWKRLVFSQFHDFIPGSSVWDVYLEGLPELNKIAQEQTAKAAEVLSSRSGGVPSVFNPHALPVKRWINRPGTKEAVYVSLPPLGGVPIPDAADEEQVTPVEIAGHTVSNGLVEFRVNANGWIDRLTWEDTTVPLRDPLGQLMIFPDRAAHFEPWDIDRHTLGLGSPCRDKAAITTFREGKHRAGIRVTRKIGKASKATVVFALEAGSFLVDMTVEIDWQDPEHLIKMLFPTRYAATNARFGGPFGSVLRPQVSSSIAAEAMWEVPFSRYLAVFDEGEREGVFVATEAKYGATVRDGVVGVSLVRSPHVTGYEQHRGAWPVEVQRLKVPSPFSDLGRHRIRLAMGRYDIGLSRERQPAAVAETHFSEPLAYTGREIASPLESIRGGETLVPVWAKPTGDGGWILRLHEVAGCRGSVQIKAKKGWTLEATDLKETPGAALNARGTVAFEPYRVTSVRFRSS